MTREEAKEILGENATDESVNKFLDNYHAKEKNTQSRIDELENQLKGYSDYDTIKSQLNEYEVAKMTKEQQLEAREKAIAEKEKLANINYNKSQAQQILSQYNVEEKLIDKLVSEDEKSTIAIAKLFASQLDLTIKATKESLINTDDTPDIKGAETQKVLSLDEMTYAQKLELKRSNPAEYEKLRQNQE